MIISRRSALFALGLLGVPAGPSRSAEHLLDLLRRPGSLAFMRHALAPIGEGIAPSEKGTRAEALGPCETQRNLNDVGRADARRIGELFRRERIVFEHVFTSKWCRCRETAELIMGRPVENLPLIDSYFSDPDKSKGPRQIAELKRYLATGLSPEARVLMVTHGSLIHDLAGFWTDEAEIVVFKLSGGDGPQVIGRGVPRPMTACRAQPARRLGGTFMASSGRHGPEAGRKPARRAASQLLLPLRRRPPS